MLRVRQVAHATLLRFLPTVAVATLALSVVMNGDPRHLPGQTWRYIARLLLAQSLGFGVTLLAYRKAPLRRRPTPEEERAAASFAMTELMGDHRVRLAGPTSR